MKNKFCTLSDTIAATDDNDLIWVGSYRPKPAVQEPYRVRIRIRSNFYKFQCFAVAEVWSMGWKEIYTMPPGAMKTKEGISRSKNLYTLESFSQDFDFLIHEIENILT